METINIELYEDLDIAADPEQELIDCEDDDFRDLAIAIAQEHRLLHRTLQLLIAGGFLTQEKCTEAMDFARKLA